MLLFDNNKHNCKSYFCDRCLQYFTEPTLLVEHRPYCESIIKTAIRTDTLQGSIMFKNFQNKVQVPYVVYVDFESIIKPVEHDPSQKSLITSEHKVCGFAFRVVRYVGQSDKIVMYRGADAMNLFFNNLSLAVSRINNKFDNPQPLKITKEEAEQYKSATNCWICEKDLKVKKFDYCTLTGKYRGAAHEHCIKQVKPNKSTKIPIISEVTTATS